MTSTRTTLEGAASAFRLAQTGNTGISALWRNRTIFFIACFASIGGFEFGYQQGVLGQALAEHNFTHTFASTVASSGRTGWLTSILQLGGWAGSLTAGVLAEVLSRKYTIFFASLWVVLGSVVMAVAQNVSYLYAGRFFTGIGVGLLSTTGPLYNGEISPPELRGLIIGIQQLTTCMGVMVAYWVGYGSDYIGGTREMQSSFAWRTPMIIQGVPAVFLAIGIWFLPFSPRYLIRRGRDSDALRTLAFLRRDPESSDVVQVEYLEIKSETLFTQRVFEEFHPHGGSSAWSILRREFAEYAYCFSTRDNFKRVAFCGIIMFFQQWTGVDAIVYYAPKIFQSVGLSSGTISLLASGVVGVILFLSTIPALMIIDKIGRKKLLLIGSISMLLSMIAIGIIVARCQDNWAAHAAAGWAAVVIIWWYMGSFAFSWGPASWVLVAEICPLSIRAKGAAIGASSLYINNFIVALAVPPMLKGISWGTYILFAAFLLIGIFFVAICLPETKNRTLEEMDKVFGGTSNAISAEKLAEAQREVGLEAFLDRNNLIQIVKDRGVTGKVTEGEAMEIGGLNDCAEKV